MNRRSFLAATAAAVAVGAELLNAADARRRVAVIGHTGRGDYGHGLDTVWHEIPATEIVAVADADERGLARELQKLKLQADRGFADYRKMLAEVKPEFVAICPRHPDQHRDMILAAIDAGAKGIYVEKPFCRTPAEADEILAACERSGARVAVAHRNRYHPVLPVLKQLIADGKLGRLLEIRGRGKGDHRGGDEDLWVLGSHVLNLCCYFAGEPKSCSATMFRDGRLVTRDDVHGGAEGLGPLAADEVHARYAMASGVTVFFDSIANDGTENQGFGLQLIGSKGTILIQVDRDPLAYFFSGNPFAPSGEPRRWVPTTTAGVGRPESDPAAIARVANHVAAIEDLIVAVDSGREPLCSAKDGAWTVEMIFAVFASHREGGRAVTLPLTERDHALLRL